MPKVKLDFELWPKQLQALTTEATELLFGGASEGGKSHFLRVLLATLCLSIKDLRCVLIRKKFADILNNHLYGDTGFIKLLEPLAAIGAVVITQKEIRFPCTGSIIVFQHCQDERQFTSAQGVEWDVVAMDEATQLSERLIKIFRAWCRMTDEKAAKLPEEWRGKLPKIVYTANPVGASVGFFRRQFVKARPEGAIEQVGAFKRQFIKSLAKHNLSVNLQAHTERLQSIGDMALARALDEGDWDSPLGDMFSMWNEDRHVVPDFIPPTHWFRYRSFDWGSAEPFAVYWWAVSDGEQFETDIWRFDDGVYTKRRAKLWFPRGAKIVYREWYGCLEDDPSKGIGMRNADIAKGIIERSPGKEEQKLVTLTDSYVFPDRGEEGGQTIAKTFADNGVPLTLGNTSRVTGWRAMADAFIGIRFDLNSDYRSPMLYLCENCKYARDYIPQLPRHPSEEKKREDAAEHGESTHSCDALRLGNMALAPAKDAPVPSAERVLAEIKKGVGLPTFEQAVKKAKEQKARRSGKSF